MDPRDKERKLRGIDQGQAFKRLQTHGDWLYFREWVEKAARDYESVVHAQATRTDHVALARALEGYDALHNVIDGFDRAIANLPKLQQELDQDERPGS